MDDLISKCALLRHLDMAIECKDCPRNTDGITYQKRCACSEVSDICNIITDFATFADVQPVKRGRWIDLDGRILCSYCGSGYNDTNEVKINTYLFCPNCGVDMHTELKRMLSNNPPYTIDDAHIRGR